MSILESPTSLYANGDLLSTPFNIPSSFTQQNMNTYPGLERYDLIRKIGEGGFSEVFQATDKKSGGLVAIKIIRKLELSFKQRANILKESAIMKRITHPNIVAFKNFIENDTYYYFILEMVDGGELFEQIIHYTYFSEDLARHIITQVAKAVKYLHNECGVVHRDIKPENILFKKIPFIPTPEGEAPFSHNFEGEEKQDEGLFVPGLGGGGIGIVKLADFGFSKVVWSENTATPCGTVGYTAPEIVKDERYSMGVDIWALGCVLYTLLCGFPPFYDDSVDHLTEKVAKGEFTFLSPWWDPISASAKHLIRGMLNVDPSSRLTINEVLAHPWIRRETVNHCEMELKGKTWEQNSDPMVHPTPQSSPSPPIHDSKMDLTQPINMDGFRSPGFGYPIPHTPTPLHEDGIAIPHRMKGAFEVSMAVFHHLEENQDRNRRALISPLVSYTPRGFTPGLFSHRGKVEYFELPPYHNRTHHQAHHGPNKDWWKTCRTPNQFVQNPEESFTENNNSHPSRSNSFHAANPFGVQSVQLPIQQENPLPFPSNLHPNSKIYADLDTLTQPSNSSRLSQQSFTNLNQVNRATNTKACSPILSETPFMEELRIEDSKLMQRRRKQCL